MSTPVVHDYDEAAKILRVEVTWLKRHIKSLPHSKVGRVVLFTDDDLATILRQFHHVPVAGPLAETAAAEASTAHPLAGLRPLPARGSLRSAS